MTLKTINRVSFKCNLYFLFIYISIYFFSFQIFDTRGFTILRAADSDYDKFVIWSHLASLLAPLIKPLVIFSSSIPSFFDLNWDDRLLCLKLRFFEIWIIHACRLVNCDHGTITFSNGCYLSRHQLEIIYNVSHFNCSEVLLPNLYLPTFIQGVYHQSRNSSESQEMGH